MRSRIVHEYFGLDLEIILAVPLVRSNAFPDEGSGEMLTVQGVALTNESAISGAGGSGLTQVSIAKPA